jgi:hypothetical protein
MEEYIHTLEDAIVRYNGEYILNEIKEKKDEFLIIQTEKKEATYLFIDMFEYVDVADALNNIYRSMLSGAILVAVLQLPSSESLPVTATRYKSLERLAPIMSLVSPSKFSDTCSRVGLQQIRTDTIPLKKGKAFFVGFFRKSAEQDAAADADKPRR